MILSDFGGPRALFLMIFEYFGCLGTLPGGLGHILSPRLGFLWFWRPLRHEKLVPFWLIFWYFLHHFFSVFLNTIFSWFFVIWGAPRLHFGRLFWITFLTEARKRKSVFGLHRRVRIAYPAFPNCIIFGDFLEGALREASGTRFLMILGDFEVPEGDHLAPKSHQKMRPKKRLKNGNAGSAGNRLWAL